MMPFSVQFIHGVKMWDQFFSSVSASSQSITAVQNSQGCVVPPLPLSTLSRSFRLNVEVKAHPSDSISVTFAH